MRTRRSHRSPSRERDRHDRRRERGPDDRRRSSRSHERRDRRSRSRDKSHRDRDRERERDRDRRHRDRDHDRHSHRDRDRDYDRDRRRRRREDEGEELEDRPKRRRGEESADEVPPPPPPPPPPPRDSPRRSSERAHSRDRHGDRRSRHSRDPRDEFDDSPKYGRDRGGRRARYEDDSHRRKPSPPPPTYAFSYLSDRPSGPFIDLRSHFRRKSPTYEPPPDDPMNDEPREDDSEARSVFVSQLAARLTARDLGYFFEDKLGENTVLDARIVTDRLSRRSKGSVPIFFYILHSDIDIDCPESAMWSSVQLTRSTRLFLSAAR